MNSIEALFPRAKAEIFRLLFFDPSRRLHLRELARLSGLAVGTIQREVAKLQKDALIEAERDGNRLYFKANSENPIFRDLQGIVLKTTGLQHQLLKVLQDLKGIHLAFVYGSFAEGEPKPNSDIDLFLIGQIGLRSLASPLRRVANTMNREINPTVISVKSYKNRKRAGDAYIENVTNGKKLWIIGNDNELERLA